MNEAINPTTCDRVEERIGFLYGELGDREARSFEQHRKSCSVCSSELGRFGVIKQSISAWRDQSLMLSLPETTRDLAPSASPPKRSALAALSSFFELSPLWMKGATGFAVVLLCVLLGLVVSGMLPKSQERSPVVSDSASQKAFHEAVDKGVKERLAQLASERESLNPAVNADKDKKPIQRNANVQKQLTVSTRQPNQRKPLSRAERDQLAADLRLRGNRDDDSLNLLGDRINRDE